MVNAEEVSQLAEGYVQFDATLLEVYKHAELQFILITGQPWRRGRFSLDAFFNPKVRSLCTIIPYSAVMEMGLYCTCVCTGTMLPMGWSQPLTEYARVVTTVTQNRSRDDFELKTASAKLKSPRAAVQSETLLPRSLSFSSSFHSCQTCIVVLKFSLTPAFSPLSFTGVSSNKSLLQLLLSWHLPFKRL